ncbi:protein LTO1 homolog, partial [Contarinia nasturtii]|uniref:protein LTO1 homolog n=1 Tax=Contarinia nasturtii TaxID=265458 RepID=UPI0012D4175C
MCQNSSSTLYVQKNYIVNVIQCFKNMSTIESKEKTVVGVSSSKQDINDIFDDIALYEDRISEEGYQKGLEAGKSIGNTDGYHLGYHRGAELGAELGYYYGVLQSHLNSERNTERQQKSIDAVLKLIADFPRTNHE